MAALMHWDIGILPCIILMHVWSVWHWYIGARQSVALQSEQVVREATTICPRPLQDDLWPSDLESGVRVTWGGLLCANFSLPRPLCSRLRPTNVCDRQTDIRRGLSLTALYPRGGSITRWYKKPTYWSAPVSEVVPLLLHTNAEASPWLIAQYTSLM